MTICKSDANNPLFNMYVSPKAARFLAKAIYGYVAMLNLANRHNGEDCTFYIDNDVTYYESIRKTINDLYPKENSNER